MEKSSTRKEMLPGNIQDEHVVEYILIVHKTKKKTIHFMHD
jgi:hypothetical protein